MEFDGQLPQYFCTDDFSAASPAVLTSGVERMLVDLALEQDGGRRFAI